MCKKLNIEVTGGIALFSAAIFAIIINNSSLRSYYQMLETLYVAFSFGAFVIKKNLIQWINDGLMVFYFLLVGLEIKREFVDGTLSNKLNIFIPAIVALFGLLIPIGIYTFFNFSYPEYICGWAIPTATDIAFTLSILAILGSQLPTSLKILVTTIAIFDDIAAVFIISLFYTKKLCFISLILSCICLIFLIIMNRIGTKNLAPYMLTSIIMWLGLLKSGIHATLAGIALAICIPHSNKNSPLLMLEYKIKPWVIFVILPIFSFSNAGIDFRNISVAMIFHPISLGTILGLFIGKQIGIFCSLYFFSKRSCIPIGSNLSNTQLYGISLICGIGFTMSLFIGTLAFDQGDHINMVRISILIGSFIGGLLGYYILKNTLVKIS